MKNKVETQTKQRESHRRKHNHADFVPAKFWSSLLSTRRKSSWICLLHLWIPQSLSLHVIYLRMWKVWAWQWGRFSEEPHFRTEVQGHSAERAGIQARWGDEARAWRLTLIVNVLMLVHLPVHMWVGVRMDVGVDLWVHFRCQRCAPLGQEKLLLLGQVLIVAEGSHAVLVSNRKADPVPRQLAVGGLARGSSHRTPWGAVLLRLAEPQQDSPDDEHHPRRYPDDDWPGKAVWCRDGHWDCWRFGV